MGANWGEPIPEHPGDWSWIDFGLICAAFLILVIVGVWTA